jgi:ribulose-5-phosphate 4-epimerase/fuculose-1-phosphate aldolase
MAVYEQVPDIRYMIHGHAYVKGVPMTNHYFPCGDMREVPETVELLKEGHTAINLRNHGFLLATKSLDDMAVLQETLDFNKINNF